MRSAIVRMGIVKGGRVALWISTVLCAVALFPITARADNPIIQTIYTADPAPLVFNGRVYLYTGHDEDGSTNFTMKEWRVWSSADMVNWTDHGSPLSLNTFSWAGANRDETAFDSPQGVDLARWPNRHASFGLGPHRCIGSNLARAMFKTMLRRLLTRLPDFRVETAVPPARVIAAS